MTRETSKKRNRQFSSEIKEEKDSKKDVKFNAEEFISKKIKTEPIDVLPEEEIKEELKTENPDDLSDVEYENLQVSEYERKREENLRDNAQFMASININKAKYDLDLATGHSKKPKRSISQKLKIPKLQKVYLPIRRSARIQHQSPSELPHDCVPTLCTQIIYSERENPRKPPENLKMADVLSSSKDVDMEKHSLFANSLKSRWSTPLELKETHSTSLKKFLQEFSRVRLTEEHVRKVVESRIFSLVIHPTADKVLVGAGGKYGSVGLWDVNGGLSENAAVLYRPHTLPVNCLKFSPQNPDKLFSCGYDGTLRCGHFEKKLFENIYYTPEDDNLALRSFVFLSPHELIVAQSDGNLAFIDTRTDGYKAEKLFRASQKGLRSVDIHPTQPNYIITAGVDATVCLWDIRNMEGKPKKISSVSSGRIVNSAYFSPLTGKYILSSSQDDAIRIYDSSKLTSQLPCVHSISHNMQTGRWVTSFQAAWHPSREDLFVCGSMARPRRIEVFSTEGYRVNTFEHPELINSIQSLNKLHPTMNVLVGANASGKLHVFMEENK